MTASHLRIAQLTDTQLTKLRALEAELGTCIVAMEPEYQLADLSQEKLKQLQAAEHELGIVLLAYE